MKEDDKVEQALLELNDLQSEAIQAGTNQRPSILSNTHTSAFGGMQDTWKMKMQANSEQKGMGATAAMNQTSESNGFRQVIPSMTQQTFFSKTNQGFGVTNLEGLDAEQLKERLLVAETIMKKLYGRNKELEDFH